MCHYYCINCYTLEIRPNNCECLELFDVDNCDNCQELQLAVEYDD